MIDVMRSQIIAGVWTAELKAPLQPHLLITHMGTAVDGVVVQQDGDIWRVAFPIPANLINDGLQVFVVHDAAGDFVTHFALLSGDALVNDVRAEVDLLRAELDILKRAFRKHCAET